MRPSHGHLSTRFLVNFFFVVELFNVNKTRGFGSKIEGTWARIGASWVKIGALVPPAKKLVILTHGGYFEALSGALKDPNFGKSFFIS